MACLKLSIKPLKLDCHQNVVQMAHRIQMILHEKHVSRYSGLEKIAFPSILKRRGEVLSECFFITRSRRWTMSSTPDWAASPGRRKINGLPI